MISQEVLDVVGLHPPTRFSARPSGISQALRAISRDEAVPADSGTAKELTICPIRHSWDLEEVYRLTHDAYLARGYCLPQPDGRLVHYPHLDGIPETTVLVAILNGAVAGTNSLTLDGLRGLHVDHDFKAECDAVRAEGRTLAASWRIATQEELRNETRVVMALIQETVRLLIQKGVQTCVFTFNPRHERIYKKLLNMETLARHEGSVGALQNAPAVFMRLDTEKIPERWRDTQELRDALQRIRELAGQTA